MNELSDRTNETDALFKFGRWLYAVVMLFIFALNDAARVHLYAVGMVFAGTHSADLFIAWLRIKQRNDQAVKARRKSSP